MKPLLTSGAATATPFAATLFGAALLASAACAGDVAEPYQLDHARILGIRTEPAVLPPGQRASLEVLFTDSVAGPRLARPRELTLSWPAGLDRPELRRLLHQTEVGWALESPDAATLQAIRAALGTSPEAPLSVPIDLSLVTADGPLVAQKLVTFGPAAANPAPPRIWIGGSEAFEVARLPPGQEVSLSVDSPSDAPSDEVTYRWFSSFGELRRYTRPEASITTSADDVGSPGYLVVVARDARGGTSWKLAAAQVTE